MSEMYCGYRGRTLRGRLGYVGEILVLLDLGLTPRPRKVKAIAKVAETWPWLLLDRDNGNPERGRGWIWVFKTREQARRHRARQNANPKNAELVGPFKTAKVTVRSLKRARQARRRRSEARKAFDRQFSA